MARLSALVALLGFLGAFASLASAGCSCNCNENGCDKKSPSCCANGTCPTPIPTSLCPAATPTPSLPQLPPSSAPPSPTSTTASSTALNPITCPVTKPTPHAPAAAIDVDLYWDECCRGSSTHLTMPSASVTTSDIPYPATATRCSLNINAIPADCLLNFYNSINGWGSSPGVTYSPGKGEAGSCVPYPWYDVPDIHHPGHQFVARMINVTCGPGVVENFHHQNPS